jgi:hypothetical protein
MARDEEDALVLADVDRQGGRDSREDDRVVEGNESVVHDQVHFL